MFKQSGYDEKQFYANVPAPKNVINIGTFARYLLREPGSAISFLYHHFLYTVSYMHFFIK